MTRALIVAGLANARDLGGLARADGTTTPTGVFVRTERLDRVQADGWRALHDHGVRTVLDLRRPDESLDDVPADFTHLRVDLDGADEKDFWAEYEADGRWGTPLYYLAHLHTLPHRLAEVLRTIATVDTGAILFHCAAGWDRTGLLAAVLLKALDVTVDDAVADYLQSFRNADAMSALHERSFHVPERHQILERHGHTAESAFREMYEGLDLDAWFARADVDPQTRQAITTWRGAVSLVDRTGRWAHPDAAATDRLTRTPSSP